MEDVMENVIDSIRAAIVSDATPEAKAVGAAACRAILAALEGTPGQPLAAPVAVPLNGSQIAGMVSALRGGSPDQLLDLAIARLRAALPGGTEVAPVVPFKFNIAPVPRRG